MKHWLKTNHIKIFSVILTSILLILQFFTPFADLIKIEASGNQSPTINIIEPDGDTASNTFNITWNDSDSDNNAQITLYYDNNNSDNDGVLIKQNINEDDVNNSYSWDTSIIEPGTYYIYAIIEDGVNSPVINYSPGTLSIDGSSYIPAGFTSSGSTDGNFSVTQNGTANYSIPINIPPGTGGVEPRLSLNYLSQGVNGYLGLGWNLTGISAITRCSVTSAQDGFLDDVGYDNKDKFCLDGQRLIAVSGSYGANNTEYRTELESFSKVTSHDVTGSGPDRFLVKTKSGLIMEYGMTEDSKIQGVGRIDVLVWNLSKVSDTVGNYMTISYHENTTTGEFYPTKIEYTGNSFAQINPYNTVEFNYEDRNDIDKKYIAGGITSKTKRLQSIKTYYGVGENKEIVRSYTLSYFYDSETSKSHLSSITECGEDGTCFAPTTFEWNKETTCSTTSCIWTTAGVPYTQEKVFNHVITGGLQLAEFVDVNGDGYQDVIFSYKTTSDTNFKKSYLWTPSGWTLNADYDVPINIVNANNNKRYADFVDVNGDGYQDFVISYYNGSSNQTYNITYLNRTPDSTCGSGCNKWLLNTTYALPFPTYQHDIPGVPVNFNGAKFVDLNGDGLVDWLYSYLVSTVLYKKSYINTGSGWQQDDSYLLPTAIVRRNDNARFGEFVDLNADGRPDWVVSYHNGSAFTSVVYYNVDTPNCPTSPCTNRWIVNATHALPMTMFFNTANGFKTSEFADVNGDGYIDFLLGFTSAGSGPLRFTYLNTGKSWLRDTTYDVPMVFRNRDINFTYGILSDVNSDGLVDLVHAFHTQGDGTYLGVRINKTSSCTTQFCKWVPDSRYSFPAKIFDYDYGLSPFGAVLDHNGDGSQDILRSFIISSGQANETYENTGTNNHAIKKIIDGKGEVIEINYKPLTDNSVYTKYKNATVPQFDLLLPVYVVSSYTQENLVDGVNTFSYKYEGAKTNMQGRGFLGFAKLTQKDERTGIESVSEFSQTFPYIGTVLVSQDKLTNGTVLQQTTNSLNEINFNNGVHFPYVSSYTTIKNEINGNQISSTTSASTYDNFGNPTQVIVDKENGFIETTNNTYTNNTTNWFLGRLTRAQVVSEAINETTQTKTSDFEYSTANGLLTKEIVEPGHSTLELTKTYTHDVFGNILTSTYSGPGVDSRTTTSTYDSKGRFEITSTNGLNHTNAKEYDQKLGVVTKTVDANNLEVTFEYDGFGRQTKETQPTGVKTHIRYIKCDSTFTCPTNGSYYVWSKSSSTTPVIIYYDKLDREIRVESRSLNGEKVFNDTQYNNIGLVLKKSLPYFENQTPLWTNFEYDVIGRETKVIAPDNSDIETFYNGLTTEVKNDKDQITKKILNVRGEVIESIDSNNMSTYFRYDSARNLIQTKDSANNETNLTYDIVGNKLSLDDPDSGITTFQYNVFGEVISRTNANNQTVSITYDKLGRLVQKVEQEGTSNWVYDSGNKAVGQLSQITTTVNSFQQDLTYDNLGRLDQKTTTIDSVAYTTANLYDFLGRLNQVNYPLGFKILNEYNTQGYLAKVRKENNLSILWKLNSVNSKNQTTHEEFGNGVNSNYGYNDNNGLLTEIDSAHTANIVQDLSFAYDTIGNLTSRSDNEQSVSESFDYDILNRLTSSQVSGQGAVTLTYDDIGNIASKSDVGTYTYGQNGAGVHAVTSTSGTINANYSYDASGNRLNPTNDSGSISYSSFSKPVNIVEGTTELNFMYDPNYSLYKQMQDDNSGSLVKEIIYIDGLFEKELTTENSITEIKYKNYITNGKKTVAIYTEIDETSDNQVDTTNTIFLHSDHLGSTESLTNELGSRIEKLNFDSWGRRRTSAWIAAPLESIASEVNRGYTGHKQLDSVSLVHMGGRVYDPVIGRFLSADPFVQEKENSQNLNRYSYVLNNPLSNVDPTGYFFKSISKAISNVFSSIGKIVANVVEKVWKPIVQIVLPAAFCSIGTVACFAAVATLSAANTLAAGGDLGMAFRSAIFSIASTAAFSAIGSHFGPAAFGTIKHAQKIVAHGLVGGISSSLQGGKFHHGFLSAGVTQAFAPAIDTYGRTSSERITAAAIIGGTAAELSGGKFANGAVTGAFSRMFNDEMHHNRAAKPYPEDFFPKFPKETSTKDSLNIDLLENERVDIVRDYFIEGNAPIPGPKPYVIESVHKYNFFYPKYNDYQFINITTYSLEVLTSANPNDPIGNIQRSQQMVHDHFELQDRKPFK